MPLNKEAKPNPTKPSNSSTKQRHKDHLSFSTDWQGWKNIKWRLKGDKDEAIILIISECCELEQKEY